MSITDSSTSLDLAYTEQSIASFTTGVLSDLDACVSEVEARLQRGTIGATSVPTETQVKNWLKRAKLELSEIRGFTWRRKYATATTTAGTYRYSMPPDYAGGYTVIRDITNDRNIKIWDRHTFDLKFPDPSEESNNEPTVACIKNMELWLVPPPDGSYTLELEYDRSGAETTADDFDWLPEIERWRCVDFATAESFKMLHQWDASRLYEAGWNKGVVKAIRADGKRKWRQMRFQAMSVFQEYAARNYQSNEDD